MFSYNALYSIKMRRGDINFWSFLFCSAADPQDPPRGSRTSLNSSVKGPESETDSMVEYGEGESSKFGEDGSFIGQYGAKRRKEDTTSPSALATFV